MENQLPEFRFSILRIFDSVFYVEEGHTPVSDDVEITYGMGFHFNVEENWLQYNIMADFSTDATSTFATGTVVTKFGIENLKSFADVDGVPLWPANALEIMFGIAFSHMRALLAKNMSSTKFVNFVVPLVNAGVLFKQLMESNPNYKVEQIRAEDIMRTGDSKEKSRSKKSATKK